MSRHSHWAKIKHDKAISDKKKGAQFSRLLRAVQIAARDGSNPETNFKLRLAIDQAKDAGITKETIERAIARGSGASKEGAELFEEIYEGFAPGGAAVMVEVLTDNKNRSYQEIKHLFSQYGGNLSGPNSVAWQFERKGIIRLPSFENLTKTLNLNREDLEFKLIEAGAQDILEEDEGVSVLVKPEELKEVSEKIKNLQINPDYVGLGWVPKNKVEIPDSQEKNFQALFEALDERDDVKDYYTNAL